MLLAHTYVVIETKVDRSRNHLLYYYLALSCNDVSTCIHHNCERVSSGLTKGTTEGCANWAHNRRQSKIEFRLARIKCIVKRGTYLCRTGKLLEPLCCKAFPGMPPLVSSTGQLASRTVNQATSQWVIGR